jgi:hypothetical protein
VVQHQQQQGYLSGNMMHGLPVLVPPPAPTHPQPRVESPEDSSDLQIPQDLLQGLQSLGSGDLMLTDDMARDDIWDSLFGHHALPLDSGGSLSLPSFDHGSQQQHLGPDLLAPPPPPAAAGGGKGPAAAGAPSAMSTGVSH